MKKTLPLEGAFAWGTLGLRWLEMMAASGHVISRRSRRNNSYAQLYGMGSEKMRAALESSQAMSRHMARFPAGDPLAMWNAWAGMLGSGMAPFHARAVRNARSGRRRG